MARTKGAISKRSQVQIAKAGSTGEMPLDYMLKVMRDDTQDKNRRDDMAKAAAPYLHAKLAAIQHSAPDGGPIKLNIVNFGGNNTTE